MSILRLFTRISGYSFALFFVLSLTGCLARPKFVSANGSRSSFDHTLVKSMKCMECHEATRPDPKIDASTGATLIHGDGADCAACHVAGTSWRSFPRFSHTPTPESCVSCHQSNRPTQPVNRFDHTVAGTGDCVSCHAGNAGIAWAGALFSHMPIPTQCATCHEGNRPLDVVAGFSHDAGGSGDCSSCHFSPGVKWSGATFSHTPNPASCNDCHANKRPVGLVGTPPFDHASGGSGDCVSCHKQPGVVWSGAKYDHTPTPTSCNDCHAGKRPVGLVGSPPFDHASGGSGDCVSCHKQPGVLWSGASFSHKPAPASCNNCHEAKRPVGLIGTPPFDHAIAGKGDCVSCHKQPGVTWSGASFSHSNPVPTTCIGCHLSKRPSAVVNGFDHSVSGTGDCVTCHKQPGVSWAATTYTHNPVPATCANCHSADRPATLINRFSHTVAGQGDCKSCHNKPGVAWTGGTYSHNPAPTQCSVCHTSNRPTGAAGTPPFNHATAGMGDCSSCHKSFAAWSGAKYDHTPVPTTCIGCHLSKRPVGPVGPVGTPPFDHANGGTGDCVSCHKKPGVSWTGGSFSHTPAPTACSTCHSAERPKTLINRFSHTVAGTGDCVGCHKKPGVDWLGAVYTHNPKPTSCATCHSADRPTAVVSNFDHSKFGTGDCASCHKNPGGVWSGATYSHANPTPTTCFTCHSSNATFKAQSTVPNTRDGFNHKYGTECASCHKSNIGVSWAGGKYNHSPLPATKTCKPCHTNREHNSSQECATCHKTYGSWAH